MRIHALELENVGPFDHASMRFLEGPEDPRVVALITGENGTGKTVIIDAIRAWFGSVYSTLERDLRQRERGLTISVECSGDQIASRQLALGAGGGLWQWPNRGSPGSAGRWVLDYWRSELARDVDRVTALQPPNHAAAMRGALQGTYRNVDVAQQLCFLDYLRDSRQPDEQRAGDALWSIAEEIVKESLLRGGRLSHIERATFTPMVEQAGHLVPLANLSSGNAYLIGRLLTLLGRVYSITVLRKEDPATAHQLPGLLLIDEAENHLHPAWQKRFLPTVRRIFPNLQIIATTHSPFVLASVEDARVFVCRYDDQQKTCTVTEEDRDYSRLPVDEILASPAFDETLPFGERISALLRERDEARDAGDTVAVTRIERELKALNPTYFGFLDLENRIRELRR